MNNISKSIKGISVFLLYILVPMVLPSITTTDNKELIVSISGMFLLLLVFLFVYKDDLVKDIKALNGNVIQIFKKSIMYFLILLVGFIALGAIIDVIFPGFQYTNSTIISSLLEENFLVMVLYVFVISLVIEQIVFRKVFKDILHNKYFFIIFSGIIYGIFQVGYNVASLNDVLTIITFAYAGIILSTSYEKTNNIVTPCLVYLLYDLFYLFLR